MYNSPMEVSSGENFNCKKRRGRTKKSPQTSKIITINLPTSDVICDNHNAQSSILIPTCGFSFQPGNGYSDGCLAQDNNKQPMAVAVPTSDYLESCMLKSHLIQQSGDEECTEKMNENRKEFFESLFTFMIGRNTPITRIPLLGFKKCKELVLCVLWWFNCVSFNVVDLYELFHLTNKLGGYEQVRWILFLKCVYSGILD